jgi:hypothetical protein
MGNARSDRHLERKPQERDFRKRYQKAEEALKITLQFGALRRARGRTQQQAAAVSLHRGQELWYNGPELVIGGAYVLSGIAA